MFSRMGAAGTLCVLVWSDPSQAASVRIRIRALHKYWDTPSGKLRVLENLELAVERGEFVAIMGPSGSGKSTLLHLLGCLDTPTFGNILLDDADIGSLPESQRERLRLSHIGFVFQKYNLMGTLNVQENVTLPMELAHLPYPERLSRSLELLQLVGLESRADDEVGNLSGGQQQRIAIARALANLPGLLLADEPTGNLDARMTQEVMEVFRAVNQRRGITTVLVTHDPQVAGYAGRVYVLDEGRLRPAGR